MRFTKGSDHVNKIYNIALIGCGCMGGAHLDDIYYKDNVNISYVCDLDIQRAMHFARRYNAQKVCTDYMEILDDDAVDIVIIATYPSSHLTILKKCIVHKKHVICEKPIAPDIESGEAIIELIKNNPKTKVLVGYILRHNKTYQKVAEMIQGGAIGFPIVMRMSQNHHTMDWDKYRHLLNDASPILDCGVHYIDVMHWFTGARIISLSGIGLRTEENVPDNTYNYGLFTAKLSDGSIGYYEAGWGNTISANNLKEFVGPKGRITITYQMSRFSNQEEGDLIEYYKYPEKTYEIINVNCNRKPTGDQLEELINMIETDSRGNPTIDEVWESFKMAIKADEFIRKTL